MHMLQSAQCRLTFIQLYMQSVIQLVRMEEHAMYMKLLNTMLIVSAPLPQRDPTVSTQVCQVKLACTGRLCSYRLYATDN